MLRSLMIRVLSDVQFSAKWVIKLNEKTSQNQKALYVDLLSTALSPLEIDEKSCNKFNVYD